MPRDNDVWSLVDEALRVVAEAAPGTFSRAAVAPVGRDRAAAAHSAYRGLDDHSFDGCFVCGPGREPGDGLRLAPGVIGEGRTACVWTPDDSLADPARPGVAGREFVWAALDCPGGWTSDLVARPLVLGRMTATVVRQPQLGRPVVVVGELAETQGRKTLTSVSAYADDGTLVGRSEQTWIEVDPSVYST
jgi:hypothetical protein